MERYDYLEAVKADVKQALADSYDENDWRGDREGLEEQLNDDLWINDSVTGNASGSYTFSRAKAAEYVFANMDTVAEALREFCTEPETIAEKFLEEDWEYFDVTARCYILGQAIAEVLDEAEANGAFDEEPEEEEEENAGALDRIAAAMREGFDEIAAAATQDPETVTE